MNRDSLNKRIQLGHEYYDNQQYTLALEVYLSVLDHGQSSAALWAKIGVTHLRLNNIDEAFRSNTRALELDSKNIAALLNQGGIYFMQGQYDKAKDCCLKVLETDESNISALDRLGNAYHVDSQFDKAIASYKKLIKIDNKNPRTFVNLAQSYEKVFDYEKAITNMHVAIKLDPNNSSLWYGLGTIYDELVDYNSALSAYNSAVNIDANNFNAWLNKGVIYNQLGEFDKSLESYMVAIEIEPNNPKVWNNLGTLYSDMAMFEESIKAYEKGISIDQLLGLPWNGIGNAYADMGSYSKAINAYETQINIDPITPMPWVGLGDTYIDLEQYSKAKKSYLNAINIDKNICEAWVGLGKVEIKLNHYASAIESLTRSTDIDENHGSAWYFKGVAYRMLSNYSESYNCYYKSSNLLSRVKSYKNRMIIVNLIKDIDENYEAPLLLKQIFELNQWLLNRYIYSKIYVSSVNICKHYLNLIEYISSDNFKRNKSDKLVLIGLIYYYMADYDSAYEIFDAVDSENEANLMGQYYLLSTLNRKMKLREYDSVLKYAFTTISNNVDNGLFENLQQKYYLGLLYNLIDKNSEALEVFKNINDFIPATFMSLLCAHKLKNKPGIKNLIEEVYDSDASYFKKTKNSFILGVQKTAIDILDEYWDEPFKMYANSIEISEAIVLVHKFIDDYEKKYKVVPKKMKYIDKGYRIEIDQGQLPFTLLDSTINKLEIFKREQINEHVLSLEKELVNIFDEIPLMDEHKTKLIDDEELAYIIENDNNNKSDKYKKLILFYYLRGNLSSKKTLILIFYLYLLDFRKNKKISGILMMSIERALSSFIISYTMSTFFESQIYSALLTSFGAAFIPLFHGYLKKLESEKIEQITYKELRDGFVSHVSYLIARNNVKFMKIYEFDDVDMWMNK